jgi:hypothetical protein
MKQDCGGRVFEILLDSHILLSSSVPRLLTLFSLSFSFYSAAPAKMFAVQGWILISPFMPLQMGLCMLGFLLGHPLGEQTR